MRHELRPTHQRPIEILIPAGQVCDRAPDAGIAINVVTLDETPEAVRWVRSVAFGPPLDDTAGVIVELAMTHAQRLENTLAD